MKAIRLSGVWTTKPKVKTHLRALGTMVSDVWLNLMLPIVREHPDLDPDKKQ